MPRSRLLFLYRTLPAISAEKRKKLKAIIKKYNTLVDSINIPFYTFYNFSSPLKNPKVSKISEPNKIIFKLRMEGIKEITTEDKRIDFVVPNLKGIIELQIMMWIKNGYFKIDNDTVNYHISLNRHFINQWIFISIIFGTTGLDALLFIQIIWIIRLFGIYFRHYIFFRNLKKFI